MRAVLRWVAIGAGVVLVVTGGLGWASYRKFSGNIRTDRVAEQVLARYEKDRPRALVPRARNILVLGSGGASSNGSRHQDGPPGGGYSASGEAAPDEAAAVLLHLSADRRRAAAVAVPGAMKLAVPACPRPGGGTSPAAYEPFRLAFRGGGAACAILAFERFSGIRVDHHLVVDSAGFDRVEAMSGSEATAGRRRRALLRTLAGRARGGGTLRHPARFFGLVDTATSSLTADPGLGSLPALYELAGSLRRVPDGALAFRTLPAGAAARPLLAALRSDRPVQPVRPEREERLARR
ncbi:hypothetical protein [Actinacidiphila alni]|uniref:hypothetical protein n=1 Tax=Actinacidiphila alni TaxID=380248 RepID=UPI0034546054